MKVVAFNGSVRRNGNTEHLIRIVFEELQAQGIETESVFLGDKRISFCKGCFACSDKKECIYSADDFTQCFEKMISADGILLASPVYAADMSALMKLFLDRASVVAATNKGLLRYKVGASVAAVRRAGGLAAVDAMNHFFMNKEMIVVGSSYWNMCYGKNVGDVLTDREGIENMHNLGQNMSWLLRKLEK